MHLASIHILFMLCVTKLPNLGCLTNMNIPGDRMENVIGLSSKFMLNIPITGLLLRLWGIQSVDPKNLNRLMKSGQDIALCPGGF